MRYYLTDTCLAFTTEQHSHTSIIFFSSYSSYKLCYKNLKQSLQLQTLHVKYKLNNKKPMKDKKNY